MWADEFDAAREAGATHLITVVDYYSRENSAVPVMPGQDVTALLAQYAEKPMISVLQVYDLSMDRDTQLADPNAWNAGS